MINTWTEEDRLQVNTQLVLVLKKSRWLKSSSLDPRGDLDQNQNQNQRSSTFQDHEMVYQLERKGEEELFLCELSELDN